MTDIQLIVFDLDGTLINAYQAVYESLNHTLGILGYSLADDLTIKRSVGWGERHLMSCFVREEDVDKAISIYRQHHKHSLKRGTTFMPGAKDLLKALKEKEYKLAVATNRPQWSTNIILTHLRIKDRFSYILCGDMVEHQKPDKEILERILRKFDLQPHQAFFVGDMTVDVQTGHNAGVATVAIATGSSTKEEISALNPFVIFDNISNLIKII